MPILGLVSTESFSAERFTNVRRKVFYMYPNGAAPLTGILSLLKEEDTNDPVIQWYEKRYIEQRTVTTVSGGVGPFLNAAGAGLGSLQTLTVGTEYQLAVADSSTFRPGHVFKGTFTRNSLASTFELQGVVTAIPSSTAIKFRVNIGQTTPTTITLVDNLVSQNYPVEVLVIGSAYSEGSLDISRESYTLPTPFTNYTQIFRTPFTITGTAYKTEAKFDSTGIYKDKAKEHSVNHMLEIEKALIFGAKSTFTDPTSLLPTRTFDGILRHLVNWEAAASPYRGAASAAVTLDTDDDKRIIANSAGIINYKTYNGYMERLFRVTNNNTNEKLCLCGSGHLNVLTQMFQGRVQLTARSGAETPFGMPVVEAVFPFGTVFYRTHPMLTKNAATRANGLYLDVHALMYRPMAGRDTDILKNRQPNDADYRKDEWLTEASLECKAPESHMYIQNVLDFQP